ncbi:MAG: hypothetical protein E7304_10815 [Butyrivibrio sp.]|jgi:hypothetical protein|uniref:hypothetical protein n=1 Tax=Butyrivibrio sp. TaxID=28121 RepID=UPI001EB0C458|nr:hypothetical protein [Butyrivibrio sp.]MBE5841881.1 hypothetical protein [Butyrivibrio sp.]
MKLKINCDKCDARKIVEENYTQYDEIVINTDELVVDSRSKAVLNRLPFNISADYVRSRDDEESQKPSARTVNGIYEINESSIVEDDQSIVVNGVLKIAPKTENILRKYESIVVNGIILCPKSVASILPLPGLSINGLIKAYPDDYTLLDNNFKLDKYFPMRATNGSGYFAASYIYDADLETNFSMLAEKNIKFHTDKIYIRKSHLEAGLSLFNIEAEINEVPDICTIVQGNVVLDESFITAYGTNPYVIGNLDIPKENKEILNSLESLTVNGTIKVDNHCVEALNSLNASYKELVVVKGVVLQDRPIINISRDILEDNADGVTIQDCAVVKFESNIEPELIKERVKIKDCAKVDCSSEQKSAVDFVSTDVAMVGTGSILSGIFNSIFGDSSSDGNNGHNNDTKYVNADYYEL